MAAPQANCAECGDLFDPGKTHRKYCGPPCRTIAKSKAMSAPAKAPRKRASRPRDCLGCGKYIGEGGRGKKTGYCSKACKPVCRATSKNSREQVQKALATSNNISDACYALGRSEKTVRKRVAEYGLEFPWKAKPPLRMRGDGYFSYSVPQNHRRVYEARHGVKLPSNVWVHHIDGDKSNNSISNLAALSPSRHGETHGSLERVAFELMKLGFIEYDRESDTYRASESAQFALAA